METVYMVCAVVGGTLIVCQFLVTMLGLGGHHDAGGGHDVGGHDVAGHDSGGHESSGHHESGHESETNWFFSRLTFRTVTAAFAFFGLAGLASLRLELEELVGMGIALGAGAAAFFAVSWLTQFMSRLNLDGTIRIERAVGSRGTVYLSIPGAGSGVGKVHVNLLNRTVEYKAITSREELATGTKIVVVAIAGTDTVEVAPTHSERTSNA